MIKIRNLSKIYGSVYALKNFNLSVGSQEFVFVMGASGSGKSTIFKILTREEQATNGEVIVNGTNLKNLKNHQIPHYRRRLGIIFQDFRLIDKMNVFENIAFPMRIFGASSARIEKKISDVLEMVSLGGKIKSYPHELSGGEKQRVGIARALINKPEIILADEPTGNIDPEMSHGIVKLLSDINKKGIAIIMATHDVYVVSKFDFRKIELKNGVLIKDSAKTELDVYGE
ncbi:MAG: cell division ATP-binding protein FtsE [Candidatus Improbicoccus pseudotrichonymphae]|uniref:Cell division ATP-binding protein FtsE n=1 Tax=Candidatus Improbicoccus pseudotrichonymphae TaxID=3033792 RepID=A0AA48KYZ4_9FIRM|nr:MAG: cell division ATP-binding protein FtsE [Candidatus Improbicoccus pseudotrichonymphae]